MLLDIFISYEDVSLEEYQSELNDFYLLGTTMGVI